MGISASTPHQIGHHLDAFDQNGRAARDSRMGWDLWADFNPRAFNPTTIRHDGEPVDSLANAREHAEKLFASQPHVWTVTIRESIQEFEGCHWTAGRVVATITREQVAPESIPAKPNCNGGHNFNGSGLRCWCGSISID